LGPPASVNELRYGFVAGLPASFSESPPVGEYMKIAAEVANENVETPLATQPTTWWNGHVAKGKEGIAYVLRQARVLTLLMKHPRASWASRAIAVGTVSYILSPIQLIPTFIPVIGQLDDLFVLFVGMKLIRRLTPAEVLADCARRAESPLFRTRTAAELKGDAPVDAAVVTHRLSLTQEPQYEHPSACTR
jgi:uncharacterized membrane protein YkvA (DUF1232 family)